MSCLKHIIWDWNGTLLNDTWLCVEIINRILADHRLPVLSQESHRERFDFPVEEYYTRLGFNFGEVLFSDLSVRFFAEYDQHWTECPLQPHVREAMAEAEGRGLSSSVLSAARQQTLERDLDFHGIREGLRGAIGQADMLSRGKLETGRDWIAQLPWDPPEVLLIGDTLHDWEVAQAMGTRCALVSHGHQHPSRLKGCGAPVYSDLESLMAKEVSAASPS